MLAGVLWTFALVGGGLGLGFLIGLPIAIGQVYGGRVVKAFLDVYVWFFRGVPLLVLLFLFYWGVFPALGHKLPALEASIIVLGLRSGAYQSQIFRGAIESVGEGQMVAARSLGMSRVSAILHIILPQALRIAIPGWTNEYAILLKDSAICFTLGVLEILTRTRYVVIATGEALLPYITAGFLFIFLTYGGTKVLNVIYEKTRIPGLVWRM
ncbi:MAG: polar amino acid ABC transporter permease [Desulfurococcales archaeon ex4484_204]|nr:MAG: polar amino acid ABC transporter permease [Desulfurococcales archaeon ex4484_204]